MAVPAANTGTAPPVPADALDRVLEALSRMRKYLPAETQRKLSELFDVDNLLVLGAVLAVWAGLQVTPIGWIADWALTLYAAYGISTEVEAIITGVKMAIAANSDAALEQAAKKLAAGITDAVVDALLFILGMAAFKKARAFLRDIRGKLWPKGSRFLSEKPPVGESAVEKTSTETRKGGAVDAVASGGALVGATHGSHEIVGASQAWKWGLGATVLVVALGAGTYAATRRKPKRKWSYAD